MKGDTVILLQKSTGKLEPRCRGRFNIHSEGEAHEKIFYPT